MMTHARAVADFGAEVTPDVEADYHRFQFPEDCRWRDLRKVHENVGVALRNILDRVQQADPDTSQASSVTSHRATPTVA